MHCCWTRFFNCLVFTVLLCTSVVSAAPIPVRRLEGHPPPPSTRAKTLTRIVTRGLAKSITGAILLRANNDTLSQLFPIQGSSSNWTTLASASGALPLDDNTLRPHNVAEGVKHTYVNYDGKLSLKSHYPAGSWSPHGSPKGGISFYAPGPANVDLTTASEAIFSYSVLFPTGFDFVKGGKLPGFYGGDDDAVAMGCSGGRRDPRCFSSRLMWRPGGEGELYTYLPSYSDPLYKANEIQCSLSNSTCNPQYGASLMRGSFTFTPGQWKTMAQRLKLNTVGNANGELELFVDGQSTIKATGLILTGSNLGRIRGLFMQSFFGGSTQDWATPKDQDVYFADLSVAILKTVGA